MRVRNSVSGETFTAEAAGYHLPDARTDRVEGRHDALETT